MTIDDFQSVNLKLENEIKTLKAENHDLKIKLEALGMEKKGMNFVKQSSNNQREQGVANARFEPSSTESKAEDIPSKVSFEYYEFHDKGIFDRSNSKQEDSQRSVFKIETNNASGILYLITGKMDSIMIADKDIFLEDVCNVTILPGGNRNKIILETPGSVELQGNSWIVKDKIQIKIQ